jgi:ATP-dependent helicase/nuclease subunit A
MTDPTVQPPKPRSSREQNLASNPSYSSWVSANAGSGKTHVLAHRVIRLLLNRVAPGKILCLTFTKAAAANMARRVFDTLSQWTSIEDDALREAVREIAGHDYEDLDFARTLFAQTIETPGGLKIQTIHAFCERLLHMFPFEANIAAGFSVAEGDEQQTLLQRAREDVLALAIANPASPPGVALQLVASLTTQDRFDELLRGALAMRAKIADAVRDPRGGGFEHRLAVRFGLAADATLESIEAEIFDGGPSPADWRAMASVLAGQAKSDREQAARMQALLQTGAAAARLAIVRQIFLTGAGEPRKRLVTNKTPADITSALENEQVRFIALLEKRKAAACIARSLALFELVEAIFKRYAQLKTSQGLLDFNDLIERTVTLLGRSDASWVLYKLDSGIDHILVDEAQDTSPDQWKILENLTGEFFAGLGAREGLRRTIFAVGDEKQSIYSFQGARPDLFVQMRRYFEKKAGGADHFKSVELTRSYRSAKMLLDQVDATFQANENFKGVVSQGENWMRHEANKGFLPGLVEIWDLEAPLATEAHESWLLPVDTVGENAPEVRLAQNIARVIRDWLKPGSGQFVHGKDGAPRPVNAGDVIILVRKRSRFFNAIIRALKSAGVPVAGADVLSLTDHIAVMDLMAAGRTALLPQDDLSLACVLKSPLIGLTDDDLLAFAPKRAGSLYEALCASPSPQHVQAATRIDAWRRLAARLTPFGFYAHLLGVERGRYALLKRLGVEANDAIDEFLNRALQHEQQQPPSLSAFLHVLSATEASVKRDLEAAGEVVRVMTVHAAKGLEGKIVFLPDTTGAAIGRYDPNIVLLDDDGLEVPVWRKSKKDDPPPVNEAIDRARIDQDREHRRLLYVAMTRAEERLYICGFRSKTEPPPTCWYNIVHLALADGMEPVPAPWDASRTVLRIGSTAQAAVAVKPASPIPAKPPTDHWLWRPAPREAQPAPPLSPSTALAAADQLDARANTAGVASGLAIGSLMHALLQYLPDVATEDRAAAAGRYLAARGGMLSEAERTGVLAQALALLAAPAVAALFGPGSRAEIAIAGKITGPGGMPLEIAGRIDRLAVRENDVLLADFKTGTPRPAEVAPAAYIAQMALYRAAVEPLYPDKTVRPFIVWTANASAVELPDAMLTAALGRILG